MRRSARHVSSAYSWEPEPRPRLGFGRLFLATLVLAGGLELARRTLLGEADPRAANRAALHSTEAEVQPAPALTRLLPAEMSTASKTSAGMKPAAPLVEEAPSKPVTAETVPIEPNDATAESESAAKAEQAQTERRKAARAVKAKRRRAVVEQQRQRAAPRRRAYDRHYADDYRALRRQEWPGAGMGYGFGHSYP